MFEHTPQILHDLHTELPALLGFNSTNSLEQSRLYQDLKPRILKVLHSFEMTADHAMPAPENYYRAVAWNVERGTCYEEILHFLKNHDVMSGADVLLLTETDLGMARSRNRNVARDLAKALGMNYFFAPSYLNLEKGNGPERDMEGENELGLHGNAILSRYPILKPRIVSVPNPHDKMSGKEKRLGTQRVLIATINFAGHELRVACQHVNMRSTQKTRKNEIEAVVKAMNEEKVTTALMGGDWNTSTYDSHNATSSIIGFWVRVGVGIHRMMKRHYPNPDLYFEKALFRMLEKNGFTYKDCNELGVCTNHYSIEDLKQFKSLRDWIPLWCFRFVEWDLKDYGGRCSFKLDWFAQKGLKVLNDGEAKSALKGASVRPRVWGDLRHNGVPASDHDAISVDFTL